MENSPEKELGIDKPTDWVILEPSGHSVQFNGAILERIEGSAAFVLRQSGRIVAVVSPGSGTCYDRNAQTTPADEWLASKSTQ